MAPINLPITRLSRCNFRGLIMVTKRGVVPSGPHYYYVWIRVPITRRPSNHPMIKKNTAATVSQIRGVVRNRLLQTHRPG